MNLLKTYLKLVFIRHRFNYILVIFSIIAAYIAIAITMIYIDNILVLSTENKSANIRYLYISIRTIFMIGGITFVISQYYNIMKSGVRDYCILKALGATKHNIRILIFVQIIFLIVITIPMGLFGGYIITGSILSLLGGFSLNQNTLRIIDSSSTFLLIAGAACCFIISLGIYLEIGIRKMPLSNILSDNEIIGKEVI